MVPSTTAELKGKKKLLLELHEARLLGEVDSLLLKLKRGFYEYYMRTLNTLKHEKTFCPCTYREHEF